MDLVAELQSLLQEIKNAKPVPFSASAMINKNEVAARIEAMLAAVPEELRAARGLVKERTEVLGRVGVEADELLAQARQERDRLLSRTDIVQAAGREADKIIEEAKARAREIRVEAEDYVDAKLANFEVVLQKTLAAVGRGRESLRSRLDGAAAEEVPEEPALAQAAPESIPAAPPPRPGKTRLRRR